eukprot:NODE_3614_length_935_cov_37.591584_g3462_i0.p1 GENE.NODE_3614_length_935_cov_37.591584_g3462_i0~~NODE_3614_length_935_cov_37.591584_g3462_i0.p1  ORF type:complete len:280 (-),score=44.01 NODE_3614_length_935_cov_37.591584_g3462_i0:96-893(-)
MCGCCGLLSLCTPCSKCGLCDSTSDPLEAERLLPHHWTGVRLAYGGLLAFGYWLCWMLKDGAPILAHIPFLVPHACSDALCQGRSLLYCISACWALFYGCHVAATSNCIPPDLRCRLQRKYVGWKGLLLFTLMLSLLYTNPSLHSYHTYAVVCCGGGALYLMLQTVPLIDFAYQWNTACVEEDDPRLLVCIVGVTLGGYLLVGAWIGWMFTWSSDSIPREVGAISPFMCRSNPTRVWRQFLHWKKRVTNGSGPSQKKKSCKKQKA